MSVSFDFIGPSENLLLFEDFSSASCKHHTQKILPHYHIHQDLFSHTSHLQVLKFGVIGIICNGTLQLLLEIVQIVPETIYTGKSLFYIDRIDML